MCIRDRARSARIRASAGRDTVGPADVTVTPGTRGTSGRWNAADSSVTRESPSSPQRRTPSATSGSPPVNATSTDRWLPYPWTSRAIRYSSASSNRPPVGAVTSSAGPCGVRLATARSQATRCRPVPNGSASRVPEVCAAGSARSVRAVSATSSGSLPRVIGTTHASWPERRRPARARISSRPPGTTSTSGPARSRSAPPSAASWPYTATTRRSVTAQPPTGS